MTVKTSVSYVDMQAMQWMLNNVPSLETLTGGRKIKKMTLVYETDPSFIGGINVDAQIEYADPVVPAETVPPTDPV